MEYKIHFRTSADIKAAQDLLKNTREQTAAQKELKAAVDAVNATRSRVSANLAASKAARDGSNYGDNSGAAEARIQRRLAAQREETAAAAQSIPVLNEVAGATGRLENQKRRLQGTLQRLGQSVPGATVAFHAMRDPIVGAAAALAAMALAARDAAKAADDELRATLDRLRGGVNLANIQIAASAVAQSKAASSAREHAEALEELARQAAGAEAALAAGANEIDREQRLANTQAEIAKARELAGTDDPAQRAAIEARFDKERRDRDAFAETRKAAALNEAKRKAQQAGGEAAAALPGARADLAGVESEVGRRAGMRKLVEENIQTLQAELRKAEEGAAVTPGQSRLWNATWGLFGKAPYQGRDAGTVRGELDQRQQQLAGFAGSAEDDQAWLKQWQKHVGGLEATERGAGRFNVPAREATANARTSVQVNQLQDAAQAKEEIAADFQKLINIITGIRVDFREVVSRLDSQTRSDR